MIRRALLQHSLSLLVGPCLILLSWGSSKVKERTGGAGAKGLGLSLPSCGPPLQCSPRQQLPPGGRRLLKHRFTKEWYAPAHTDDESRTDPSPSLNPRVLPWV
jgi:hypothetical protein